MDFWTNFQNGLTTTFLALPSLLLAGLGGMITARVGVLNLGLEGMMLIGAFSAVVVNHFTSSWLLGLIVAVVICALLGSVFALFNIKFKVNNIIISVGINMFAIAITQYLLSVLFGQSGAFTSEQIVKMPTIPLPFLAGIPVLRALDGLSIVFWLAILITFAIGFTVNRTKWGLHIRATGLNHVAVNTAGISPFRVRTICLTVSGALCGLAGAYLSTSQLAMFTNNMTAGRGFLGNIASIIGNRTAGGTLFGSLLFSATNGFTMNIQTFGFPAQLIQLIPYIVAFAVIIAIAVYKRNKKNRAAKEAK